MSENKFLTMDQDDRIKDFVDSYYNKFNKMFTISVGEFIEYYKEAKYSGYPISGGGAVWDSEGKFIYVMVRHLKPKKILEIGNYKGQGSTNHILQAVEMNNNGCEVTLVDIQEWLEYDKLHNKNFKRVIEDSLSFLSRPFEYDLIVQDGSHEYEHVKKELQLIKDNNIVDSVLWGHDYHTIKPPQCEVQKAWDECKDFITDMTDFKDTVSNCGFVVGKFKHTANAS